MLSRLAYAACRSTHRLTCGCGSLCQNFCSSPRRGVKVAVCGASGGIGQPLSLLLKNCCLVTELRLYDVVHTPGVAADLSHIETRTRVSGHVGAEQLQVALQGAEVVVIPAGVPRKPGMTRDDLFSTNASVVRDLVEAVAAVAPQALVAIISNPVNSTVPVAAEVLKKAGVFDPRRLFGVTTLDVVRANTFVAEVKNLNPKEVNVPVIGGHAGVTIIPVFSQCRPEVKFSQEEVEALTVRVQEAGTEVVKAKAGSGSATLSMAYAGARFVSQLCRGLKGCPDAVECAYVQSDVAETAYFASLLCLGPEGVKQNLGLGVLSPHESQLVKAAIPIIKKNIETGEDFVKKQTLGAADQTQKT